MLEVIDSELEVSGNDVDEHNVVLVERIITTVSKEAIDRVGSDAEVNRIREAIDEILIEIQKAGITVIGVERQCILIKLSCPSTIELLNLLNLLSTSKFHKLLDKLADALKHHLNLCNSLYLTYRISEESLNSIHKVLGRKGNTVYKIQCESVEGLSHLWNYFEEGGATQGFNKLSKALSEYIGSEVNVRGHLNYARVGEILQASDPEQDDPDLTISQNRPAEASRLTAIHQNRENQHDQESGVTKKVYSLDSDVEEIGSNDNQEIILSSTEITTSSDNDQITEKIESVHLKIFMRF